MNIFIRFWRWIRQEDRIEQLEHNYAYQDEYVARIEQEQEAAIKMCQKEMSEHIDKLKGQIATALFMSELKPTWTNTIADYMACGFGYCDGNGFFDFEVPRNVLEHDEQSRKLLSLESEN